MVVILKNASKAYGDRQVVNNVCFSVELGEIVSIIGPSGAGKTTLLKIIAGIEKLDSGQILFDEKPSKQKPVILVFQDYILFPNLNVFENVAFGLRARRLPKEETLATVERYLAYFGIQDKAESYPNQLSAGQKQRVAIARAMVIEPSILLLDEPFANLDKGLKMETAEFIRVTQKRFGITTISVTHDLEEAFAMSDKIGIMLDGSLIQFDATREIYFNPSSYDVAKFLGPVNTIPRSLFSYFGIERDVPEDTASVFTRAESVGIEKDQRGAGMVLEVCFIGLLILYRVEIEGLLINVYSLGDSIEEGDRVSLSLIKYFQHERRS